ncbi:PAS domain S-box protein [Paenibacillus chartarius]|uniref:histidine kinase n=1 Tax=Paenibacillus chartarius TaxID=747481 RepID=A0ABV6DSH6_9BACL
MKANFNYLDAREILEQISDAYYLLDQDWNFVYLNQHAAKLICCGEDDLLGKRIWTEFPDAVSRAMYSHFHRAVREQEVIEFEDYYAAPLDSWYSFRAIPAGTGLAVYFRNITQQKKSARRQEQHYESLFRQNPDAVFSLDLKGNFLSLNPATEQLTGYSEEELLSMSFLPIMHESSREFTFSHFLQAAGGSPQIYENRIVPKNGTIIPCRVTNIPIVVDGMIVGVYGIAKDISERKRAEDQALESRLRLESIIRNNPDAIYSVDVGKQIFECNLSGERLLGFAKEELLGIAFTDLVEPGDCDKLAELMEIALGGLVADSRELHFVRKDGHMLLAQCSVVPIVIHQEVAGTYFILRDVTEQRETELLLRRAEKLNIAGQMAAAVAHEIRNPLTALKGFIKLLEAWNENSSRGYIFSVLREEMERIESITNELLVLAKPQSASYVKLDLITILESVVTLIGTQANMQNVQIVTRYADAPHVLGEGNQLKQVFVNILKNAVEVMPESGEVTISVGTFGEEVRIQFIDQGSGITEEQIARLGEPFYSTKEKGTGLGLMVSKKIIESHRGRLEVSSEIGKGTTVSIYLPLEAGKENKGR